MLPMSIGLVSGLLILWDLHNVRVIESMGMAWDTGPPFWPYEASWIALLSINAPAYALAAPLFLLFNAHTSPDRYPLFFPVIIFWWWWLGRRLDSGLLPPRSQRRRWGVGAALALAACAFYYVAIEFLLDYAHFWSDHGVLGMRLLRTAGPLLWCSALAIALTISVVRVIGLQQSPAQH
jgi:hypothetical protein